MSGSGIPLFPTYTPVPIGSSSSSVASLNKTARKTADTQATVGGNNSIIPVVFGTQVVGGRLFAIKVYRNVLYFGAVWCMGEVSAVQSVTINDAPVPGGVTVRHYTGTAGQTASSILAGVWSGYSDALPGICYSVFKCPSGLWTGFPRVTATIKGIKVPLTSGGAATWTNNPAYLLAALIENTTWGMGRTVDWSTVATAASACDALVGSPSEKKRILNLVLDQSLPAEEWLRSIADYAGCWVVPEGSSYRIVVDGTGSSVQTFNDANIVAGSMRISKRGLNSAPTMVEVTYTDTTYTPYREARYVTAAASPRRLSRIARPGITRYSEAKRYATERLNEALLCDLSATWQTFDAGLMLQVGDLVTVTHPLGLASKVMRVIGIEPVSAGRWQISAIEYDAAKYDSTVATGPTTPDTTLSAGELHVYAAPTSGAITDYTSEAWDIGSVEVGNIIVGVTVTDITDHAVVSILTSLDDVTYEEYVATAIYGKARYIKVKISTPGSMEVDPTLTARLIRKAKSESGIVTASASAAATVTLVNAYVTYPGVQVTPINTTAARYATVNSVEVSKNGGIGSGSCLRFSGSGSDYVSVADHSSLDLSGTTGFLLEALIKRSGAGGSSGETIFKKAYNYGFRLHTDATLRGYYWHSDGTRYNLTTTYVVPNDQWVRVGFRVVTGFGIECTFFVNGEEVAGTTTTTAQAQVLTNPLTIGGDGAGSTETFNGCIDDVRIWSGVKERDDIAPLITSELTGSETGLLAYWKFNEGTGTSCDDASSNSNTGTLSSVSGALPAWRPYNGFDVYLFNSSGTQIAGDVAWTFSGY